MSENKTNSGKKPNFLKGALILAVANFIVKIIGAMFKIPLFRLIGDDGSGYFNVAYQIYTFMFIVATAGFPVAVSKMVSESLVNESESCANRVFKVAFRFLAVVGLIGRIGKSRCHKGFVRRNHGHCAVGVFRIACLGIPRILSGQAEYVPDRT